MRRIAGLVIAAVCTTAAIAACADRELVAPPPVDPTPVVEDTTTPNMRQAVTCTVTVETGAVTCSSPQAGPNDPVILGGQDEYVRLETSGSFYNKTSQTFVMNVAVRNLIGQKLGTMDGTTVSSSGVRVFFASGPVLVDGVGPVTLQTIDGHANYTAAAQPYVQYNTVLAPFAVTAPKQLVFSLPNTVTSFSFTAYVASLVQFPDGWVEITPTPFPIQPDVRWKMTAIVRNVLGQPVPGATVRWEINDTTRATMTPNGTVKAVRAGVATVTATSGVRSGTGVLNIWGTTRRWTGAVSTDWFNKLNWQGDVAPEVVDSVHIPVIAAGTYPILTANLTVDGVSVADNASINLGPFDLTANGNVQVGQGGAIINSSGRLILQGTAKTVAGTLPRVLVRGSYSLTGNITTRADLRVDLGRLTNDKFRVQTLSY